MVANDQEKIKIAREYFMKADRGSPDMKMPKCISLSSDLDLDGTRVLKWLKDSKA